MCGALVGVVGVGMGSSASPDSAWGRDRWVMAMVVAADEKLATWFGAGEALRWWVVDF